MRFSLCLLANATAAFGAPMLGKGWNLGNTLEKLPDWNVDNPCEEWIFESLKEKGFDWVRIPVHWDSHADSDGNVDQDFLGTVDETVGWARNHGLVALINTHHEDWFDQGGSLDRLVAIWRQVSTHFKAVSDDELVFEIFNEPKTMSLETLNSMNAAVLPVIRETNPTRLVFLGGLGMMGRWWINANPDAMTIPEDANLGLTVHSYDPWTFAASDAMLGPLVRSDSFTEADERDAHYQMGKLKSWAQTRGVQQVVLNEFGVSNDQPNKEARLRYYKVNSEACAENGQGYAIWDDNDWWQTLDRSNRVWQEDVLAQLASPLPAPSSSPPSGDCCWNGCDDASSCTEDPFCRADAAQCNTCGGQWCGPGNANDPATQDILDSDDERNSTANTTTDGSGIGTDIEAVDHARLGATYRAGLLLVLTTALLCW
jgi:endoglucanase